MCVHYSTDSHLQFRMCGIYLSFSIKRSGIVSYSDIFSFACIFASSISLSPRVNQSECFDDIQLNATSDVYAFIYFQINGGALSAAQQGTASTVRCRAHSKRNVFKFNTTSDRDENAQCTMWFLLWNLWLDGLGRMKWEPEQQQRQQQ